MVTKNDWHLVSSHGAIVFYVVVKPGCTIKDIASAMFLTRRTVWGVIGDLRRAGMLHVRKNGRTHHYSVNLDAPFPHPVLDGITMGRVLGQLTRRAHHDRISPSLV